MKKYFTLFAIYILVSSVVFSQGGNVGNLRLGGNFLGFNSGISGNLEVRNDFAGQPINFFAGGSGAGALRMTILEQNVPNPFAEQTTINYFLPDNVVKAQMLFYNVQGRLIQSVDLNQKGKGQLNVFASDLTNGIYTYSLVVDGKIFETKKMVKQ